MTSLPCNENWNLLPSTLRYKKDRIRPKEPCKLRIRLGKPFLSQLQKRTAENPLASASRESWSWFARAGSEVWVTSTESWGNLWSGQGCLGQLLQLRLLALGTICPNSLASALTSSTLVSVLFAAARRCSSPATSTLPTLGHRLN